ncbi:hypothetical protein ACLOJK_013602 [Asimina triloba]
MGLDVFYLILGSGQGYLGHALPANLSWIRTGHELRSMRPTAHSPLLDDRPKGAPHSKVSLFAAANGTCIGIRISLSVHCPSVTYMPAGKGKKVLVSISSSSSEEEEETDGGDDDSDYEEEEEEDATADEGDDESDDDGEVDDDDVISVSSSEDMIDEEADYESADDDLEALPDNKDSYNRIIQLLQGLSLSLSLSHTHTHTHTHARTHAHTRTDARHTLLCNCDLKLDQTTNKDVTFPLSISFEMTFSEQCAMTEDPEYVLLDVGFIWRFLFISELYCNIFYDGDRGVNGSGLTCDSVPTRPILYRVGQILRLT